MVIHERPSCEMVLDGTDPRILGLFTGIPLPRMAAVERARELGLLPATSR